MSVYRSVSTIICVICHFWQAMLEVIMDDSEVYETVNVSGSTLQGKYRA